MARSKALHGSLSAHEYFDWLCDIVEIGQGRYTYYLLAKVLHDKKFHWTVPNDDNRISDAIRLREEYFNGVVPKDPATIFEVLIGIAIRFEEMMANPEKGNRTSEWFWIMMRNLRIEVYDDASYYILDGDRNIDTILSKMLDRAYTRNGNGGLFPLKKAKKDQRKVEIWYQMCTYLVDNYTFDD